MILPEDVHRSLARHLLTDGYPLVLDLERSRGSRIHDLRSGREFLDFFSFFCTRSVAINHPRLLEPEYLSKLTRAAGINPTNSDVYTVEMAEFVDTFSRIAIPPYLPHLFLISGGAPAVENALKAAFDWKVRRNRRRGGTGERGHQAMHLKEAFHGRTGYCISLTNTAEVGKHELFPKFPWPRILNPKLRFPVTEEVLAEVAVAEREALAQAKAAFQEQRDDIACIIVEPIQGEGGDNHFRPEFLRALRTLADENEALLVFDEIQTGIGLTGAMWAHQHVEVRPDLLVFGKKSQVCGVLGGLRLDEEPENVFRVANRIDSTWGGSLADMVRFARVLTIIEEEKLVERASSTGELLLAGLARLAADWEGVVDNVRGKGLMCAFDLPDKDTREAVVRRAYTEGLIVLRSGPRSVRLRPALDVTAAEVAECCDLLDAALGNVSAGAAAVLARERRRVKRTRT